MTKEEIKNTPELVDFMLDESVVADSREKLRKRLEEVCNLAIKALEQEPALDKISAEIEALPKTYPFVDHIDDYIKTKDIFRIIDKYKAESEE